jgi:hypothetical protein
MVTFAELYTVKKAVITNKDYNPLYLHVSQLQLEQDLLEVIVKADVGVDFTGNVTITNIEPFGAAAAVGGYKVEYIVRASL